MAYIPPHKQRSNEMERPLPTPELLAPQFKKILNMKPSRSNVERASYSYIYAKHSISRWCTIGLDYENQFPSSVDLEPVSLESTEWKIGEKPLTLINTRLDNGVNEVRWNLPESPWVSIAENVLEDLLASFEIVRKEMEEHKLEQVQKTQDHEMLMIKNLINSAVVDPDVKASFGDRFHVIGNWHTITTSKNPSWTLKIRRANRFAFTTSTGDTTWEIRLFLKELVSKLQEQNAGVNSVSEKARSWKIQG